MKKPYIICHMASSIDGKIIFDNWRNGIPRETYSGYYEKCHESYESQGWILGRVSLEKDFSKGVKPDLVAPKSQIERKPFIYSTEARSFAVTFDTRGTLGWNTNEIGGDHIVAVLTESVTDEYLYYLQCRGISYIFAGIEKVDFRVAMHQLVELFSINKIMLEGGGNLNGSFLNEGLIDEISLLLLPVADGTSNVPTVFEVAPHLHKNPALHLSLRKIEQMDNDVLWLRYRVDN